MCKPSCYSKYNNKHLGAIQHVQYHWGKNCCGGKVSTNQCSYYFPFVVNFLSEDEDWWIPRVLLCVLMGNYWSLLPLVLASICWSAHGSPTAWIIEMTQLSLMKFEPQSKTRWTHETLQPPPVFSLSHIVLFVSRLRVWGGRWRTVMLRNWKTLMYSQTYERTTIVAILIMMLSELWHFSSPFIC